MILHPIVLRNDTQFTAVLKSFLCTSVIWTSNILGSRVMGHLWTYGVVYRLLKLTLNTVNYVLFNGDTEIWVTFELSLNIFNEIRNIFIRFIKCIVEDIVSF